jgi:hypothetical protein
MRSRDATKFPFEHKSTNNVWLITMAMHHPNAMFFYESANVPYDFKINATPSRKYMNWKM